MRDLAAKKMRHEFYVEYTKKLKELKEGQKHFEFLNCMARALRFCGMQTVDLDFRVRTYWPFMLKIKLAKGGNYLNVMWLRDCIATNGWKENFKSEGAGYRMWAYKHGDMQLSLYVYAAEECTRVQVGTRMVEEPIYKTICPGETNAENNDRSAGQEGGEV